MTDIIRIRYGRHGMGHAVRMGRLARVLRQRGANVEIFPYGEDAVQLAAMLKANPGGTLVLDRLRNSDQWLETIRPYVDRLVVVVGVGHVITLATQWIADLVLYQNSRRHIDGPCIPGATIWYGSDYLILDPRTSAVRAVRADAGHGVAVYFGAGFPAGYGHDVAARLRHLLPGVSVDETWHADSLSIWRRSRLLVGSMGMAVYEAATAGTWVVCVSVDEEHAEDAMAISDWGVLHLGQLRDDMGPEFIARQAADVYEEHGNLPTPVACDGLGIYRVARWLLDR